MSCYLEFYTGAPQGQAYRVRGTGEVDIIPKPANYNSLKRVQDQTTIDWLVQVMGRANIRSSNYVNDWRAA